jgi:hypothetical protein
MSPRRGSADHSHADTPPWPEQVPWRFWEKLYVPSLHRAVAPAGATGPDWGRHTLLPSAFTYEPLAHTGSAAGGGGGAGALAAVGGGGTTTGFGTVVGGAVLVVLVVVELVVVVGAAVVVSTTAVATGTDVPVVSIGVTPVPAAVPHPTPSAPIAKRYKARFNTDISCPYGAKCAADQRPPSPNTNRSAISLQVRRLLRESPPRPVPRQP